LKKLLLSILTLSLLLVAANVCPAQTDLKPVVTVSFAGYDKLIGDIDMVGQLSGNPDLGVGLEMMLKMMTQGKGLAGLDTKQPWAVVVMTDGQRAFTVYGFVPVTDLKQLIDIAKSLPQLDEGIKLNDDVYEIPTSGQSIFVKQVGNWAVVTNKSDDLANAPADPLALLGDLPKRYDLAYRVSVKNAPKEYREMFLAQFNAVVEVSSPQTDDESDEEYALRMKMVRQAADKFTSLVNELDDVLLGGLIDPATKTTHLDFEMTAVPGTKLADQFAIAKSSKTGFAGLLAPGAAVTGNWTNKLADSDVAEISSGVALLRKSLVKGLQDKGLTEAQTKQATEVLNDVVDVLQKTAESKKTDIGLRVQLDSEAATLVLGVAISDGAKLEKAIKQLADAIQQEDADLAKSIKLNAETHEGVRFHGFAIPTPDQKLAALVGDTLEVVLGIGDDRLLIAAGRDAANTLKKTLDESKNAAGKEVLPLQVAVAVTPIAKFIAQVDEDEEAVAAAGKLTEALKNAGDKDHVVLTMRSISRGFRLRLEVEEGLLKALVSMTPMPGPLGLAPAK
jgi:hypothetical protein